MPRKGEDGRRLSGAQQRRLQRESASRVAAPARAPTPARDPVTYEEASYPRSPAPAADTIGAPRAWERLLGRIGEPPMNPLGNAEWANNASAALAHLALTSKFSDALERQIRLCMRLIDRISATQGKAIITREIRELQERAGIKQAARPDADRLVPVEGGVTLRGASRAVGRGASATTR
jgi:hypothetical protein